MAYSIIGMTAAPEAAFRSATRHTAQGARDLACAFQADGLEEIEIRDDRGRLCPFRELQGAEEEDLPSEGSRR